MQSGRLSDLLVLIGYFNAENWRDPHLRSGSVPGRAAVSVPVRPVRRWASALHRCRPGLSRNFRWRSAPSLATATLDLQAPRSPAVHPAQHGTRNCRDPLRETASGVGRRLARPRRLTGPTPRAARSAASVDLRRGDRRGRATPGRHGRQRHPSSRWVANEWRIVWRDRTGDDAGAFGAGVLQRLPGALPRSVTTCVR